MDSWLIWQLTNGAVHATDVCNASRTMLFNVHSNQWDPDLLKALDIPANMMPSVKPSSALYGEVSPVLLVGHAIAIGGVAGDQQSALFGQACFKAGMVKNTYGTCCFMLMHIGPKFQTSRNGLITTSVAQSVPDARGVMVVPAFTGLGAPYWKPDARGTITGLTRGSTVAHIARAALESIAFQSAALLQAMSRDAVEAGGANLN